MTYEPGSPFYDDDYDNALDIWSDKYIGEFIDAIKEVVHEDFVDDFASAMAWTIYNSGDDTSPAFCHKYGIDHTHAVIYLWNEYPDVYRKEVEKEFSARFENSYD